MARLFILIKRKGSKKPLGVIPGRPGLSRTELLKRAKQQIRPPLVVMGVITQAQLRTRFAKRMPKRRKKMVVRRKKLRRRVKKRKK